MGLWLKCPHCLTANPLDIKSCAKCSASLENLPAAKRVYIYDKNAPAAPKPAAAKPAAHEAEAAKPEVPEAAAGEAAPKKESLRRTRRQAGQGQQIPEEKTIAASLITATTYFRELKIACAGLTRV